MTTKAVFKSGDLVCLNSGGPTMTVDSIRMIGTTIESFVCCWFDNEMKCSSAIFNANAISAVPESVRHGHHWTIPDIEK
jgi:uncharacterized protein YodC (DUF2158 family)